MGGVESKSKNKQEIDVTSSPNGKNIENLSELDPRSPSENVPRTPLEVVANSKVGSGNGASTPSFFYLVDPRSPTDEFHRTPVLIKGFNSNGVPPKLHNKILDNARSSLMYTPTLSTQSHKGLSQVRRIITPPKLLESSPVTRKNIEKRKSFVGLLETNIDYTETDLDYYVKNKSLDSSLVINIQENGPGCVLEHENCDPRSPSLDFLRTPIQIVKKIGEIDLNNPKQEESVLEQVPNDEIDCNNTESLLKIAANSTNDVITETVVLECKINDENVEEEKHEVPVDEENLENVNNTDDMLVENLLAVTENLEVHENLDNFQNLPTESKEEECERNNEITDENQEPIIDLTADILEFDKKLTQIIHEESEVRRKPLRNDVNEMVRSRTPMKDRNLNFEPKKNKLKVRDKPRKSEYAVSQIPVFKDKKGAKLKVQCENTPPRGIDIRKKRKVAQPKWDTDKTLVI